MKANKMPLKLPPAEVQHRYEDLAQRFGLMLSPKC
jgi:hypothetical protein